jgi:hypothetical protein
MERNNMSEERRRITLPSGKTAEVRKGKGRDLMRAHRAVAGNSEPMSVSFALIAELVRVEEKPLVYEDVLDMDLDDVLTLEAEVSGAAEGNVNFPNTAARQKEATDLPQPRQSSDLSTSDSLSQNCA